MSEEQNANAKETPLSKAAYTLIDEIRDGKLNHIATSKGLPLPDRTEIIEELRARIPGKELKEYKDAISRAAYETR